MAISIRGSATDWVAVNATTQTVTLPTHVAGDMLIVRAGCKPFSADITCSTAGWKPVENQHVTGAVANGAGVGSMAARAFWKIAESAAETDPVVTWGTTAAPGAATAVVYQKATDEHWLIPTGAGGSENTAGTEVSQAIERHITAKADDLIDFFTMIRDNTTMTVPSFTQAGLTLGTVDEQPASALSSTTSNDIAADGGYRAVTAGASSAAAVVTGTLSTSETGVVWTTRLRVVPIVSPLVQAKMKVGGGDPEVEPFGTTIVLTLDADVTVGNTLAVWSFYGGTIAQFTSIADNLGNTYTLVRHENPSGGGEDTHSLFTAPVTVGGACTITITLSASVGYRSMLVHEVSGRHATAPLDVSGFNFQASPTTAANNITSGAQTTTVNGCYIFGVTAFENTANRGLLPGTVVAFKEVLTSPGTGVAPGNGTGAISSEEFVQTTAGSIAATFTLVGTAAPCLTLMMALKPPDPGQTITVGQASESDTAQALGKAKAQVFAQALETDTAQALGRLKTLALLQSSESDAAQGMAWSPKNRLVGQASESEVAQAFTSAKARAVEQALENDLAQGVTFTRAVAVGQASESDAASVFASAKARAVAQALEADSAGVMSLALVVVIVQALEADAAQGIQRNPLAQLLGQAEEADSAGAVVLEGAAVSEEGEFVLQRRRRR